MGIKAEGPWRMAWGVNHHPFTDPVTVFQDPVDFHWRCADDFPMEKIMGIFFASNDTRHCTKPPSFKKGDIGTVTGDLCAGLIFQGRRTAEMVQVGVGKQDQGQVSWFIAQLLDRPDDLPGIASQSGVNKNQTGITFNQVDIGKQVIDEGDLFRSRVFANNFSKVVHLSIGCRSDQFLPGIVLVKIISIADRLDFPNSVFRNLNPHLLETQVKLHKPD